MACSSIISSNPDLSDSGLDNVLTIVDSIFDASGNYTEAAKAKIQGLANLSVPVDPIVATSINPTSVTAHTVGRAPAIVQSELNFPVMPENTVPASLPGVTLPTEPTYDVLAPMLNAIDLPLPAEFIFPDEPELVAIELPAEPDLTVPPVPTLVELKLQDVPTVTLPTFSDEFEFAQPIKPDTSFDWTETEYVSTALTTTKNKLLELLNTLDTGLSATIEQDLGVRARSRQQLLVRELTEVVASMVRSRGLAVPPNALNRLVEMAQAKAQEIENTFDRDHEIKLSELAQEQFRFSLGTAVELEAILLQHHNTVQARRLEASQFVVESAIKLFDAQVALYNALVQALTIKVEIFKTNLTAALASLEVYRTQVEAEKIKSEINQLSVVQYRARLNAVGSLVDLYNTKVSAVMDQVMINESRLNLFKSRIQGYLARIESYRQELKIFETQVQADAIKVDLFREETSAFDDRVAAYSILLNGQVKAQQLTAKQNQEYPLETFKANVDAYKSAVEAEAARINAIATLLSADVENYAAVESAKSDQVKGQVSAYEAALEAQAATSQINATAAQTGVQISAQVANIVDGSIRLIGQMAGQIGAARMAAMSASRSVSGNDGYSASESDAYSRSVAHSVANICESSTNVNRNYTSSEG